MKLHIYRRGFQDAVIKDESKTESLYFVDFPMSFFGSWTITIHGGLNNTFPAVATIDKRTFSWDMTITDCVTGYKTMLVKSGIFTRKHAFRGENGVEYAWKGSGFGGDLKLVAYPDKHTVLAYYNRSMFAFRKEGTLDVDNSMEPMIRIVLATGFAVEEWERQQRNNG